MAFGSVSVLVIAICNVVWLLSVIIALGLLRALARRDKTLVTFAPIEPREFAKPDRSSEIRTRFANARAGMLAEIPAGLGRLFQAASADQTAAVVGSDPARD